MSMEVWERFGICNHTHSPTILLLRRHSLSLHVEDEEADDSISPGLEFGRWMLQKDRGATELRVTGESNLNNRNWVLIPFKEERPGGN